MEISINYVAVIVAAIAAFFIGFMWHGPVFGKQWMKLMKITPADMKKGQKEMQGKMPVYMLVSLIQQIVSAFIIALLVLLVGVSNVSGAVFFAIILWLGLIVTTLLNGVLWEKRSIPLYLFNITYHLVSLIVVTVIVTVWM